MFHEAVVLLGRAFGEGLEPVGAVGDAQLHGPLLHACGHFIGRLEVQGGAVVDHVAHLPVHLGRKILEHFLTVEHILSKELAGTFLAVGYVEGFLCEGLAYNLKSQCTRHNLLFFYYVDDYCCLF